MAMNGDKLGLAIAAALIKKSTVPPTPEMVENIQQFWKDVAAEIVGHIQEDAAVQPGITLNAGAYSGATTGEGKIK